MNSSNAEQQFNIIREIQLSHTLYNYQADVFGPSKTVDTKLKTIYHSINSLIKTILSKGGKVKRNKTKRNKTKRNKTKRNKTKRNKLHQIIT
jgi:hypothetical protein